MSETLTNGVIVPDKGSRDWYADLRSNWLKLDSLMAGGNITVNPAQTKGILVATITVGGKEYKLYQQDGDVSVKIDPSAENAEYPLVASTSAEANTGSVVMAPAVTVNPSTGAVTATSFKGKLDGNASTATNATKAVQDGTGAVITDTYATKSELGSKADDANVVHKSGNETIVGTKTFSNVIFSNKELAYRDTKYDWTDTSLNTWCDAGHVSWSDKTGSRRMHELVGTKDGVWQKACYINENPYFAVNSNRDITYWGTTIAFNGTTTFTSPIIGNLQGNANSATYATTQATTDNSTKIATTAWVRTYVNSAVGSGSVGTTITAYWGSSSSTGNKWAMVSNLNGTQRVSSTTNTFTPVVGQIYSGNQLYSTAKPSGGVGDTGVQDLPPQVVYARLNLSGAFNSSHKYLCTTAVGVNATASVDVSGHTSYTSSGPYTTITGYSGFDQTLQGGKSTFLRVQ